MENISLTIILAQIVNFLILFLIFKKFVSDKLIVTIRKRRELLKKLENTEEKYNDMIKKANEEKVKILKNAKEKAVISALEIEKLANKKAINTILKAEKEASGILEGGRRQLKKEKLTMLSQVKSHVIDLSLRLNEKILGKKEVSKEFMERELKKI